MKRILSILLSIALIGSLCTNGVWAASEEPAAEPQETVETAETVVEETETDPKAEEAETNLKEEKPAEQAMQAEQETEPAPQVQQEVEPAPQAQQAAEPTGEEEDISPSLFGTVHWNISSTPTSSNATVGSLPNAATVYVGNSYYFNLMTTEDAKMTHVKLYVKPSGSSGYSCIKDFTPEKVYICWLNHPYTFTKSGSFSYYWYITYLNGATQTLDVTTITVKRYSASLSFSSSSVIKTYGNASFTNSLSKTTDGTVTYSSSNTSVATVSSSGTVTIKGAGSATIRASSAATNKYTSASASFSLTVNKAYQSVSSNYSALSLTIGNSATLSGSAVGSISYSSNNTSVATVNSSGKVTGVGAGTATITISAASTSNYYSASKTVSVTVNKKTPALSFGGSYVNLNYGNGTFSNALNKTTDGTVTYSSSNTSVAAVNSSSGLVTINGVGTATITARASETSNYKSGSTSYSLTVNKGFQSISCNYSSISLKVGNSATLRVSSVGTVSYSSSNTSVATVNSYGKVTGVGEGTATITISAASTSNYKAASKTVSVTVSKKTVPTLSFASSKVTKTYGNGTFTNTLTKTTDGAATFSSSNTSVATVNSSSGLVTIKGAGTATITVRTAEGSNYQSGSASYQLVVNQATQSISSNYSSISLKVGGSVNLGASAIGTLSYTSSNTSVATVNGAGKVTVVGAGTAVITIRAAATTNYKATMRTISVTGSPNVTNLSSCTVTLSAAKYTYDGKAKKPTVTVKKGQTKLNQGTDYTVTYQNNVNAGTASVTVTGKGNYTGKVTKNYTIAKAANLISASNKIKVASDAAQRFSLGAKQKGDAGLSYRSNNSRITVNGTGIVTIAKGYVGSASIQITAKETTNYKKATKIITVTVNPKQVVLTAVTSPKQKYLKADWKNVAGCSGYQMQISLKSNFAGAKSKKISKSKTTYTVSGFKSKKKYYVRVRAYEKVGKKTYYGSWSKAKSVKVK